MAGIIGKVTGLDENTVNTLIRTFGYGVAMWIMKQLGLDESKSEPKAEPFKPERNSNIEDAKKDALAAMNDASDDILDDDGSSNKTEETTPIAEKEEKDAS